MRRSLAEGLPRVVADPFDLDGREHALYAAYLSATAFASAGSGLHHKICHVLGDAYNLPHAQTHAVVLPYVLAFNAPAAAEAILPAVPPSNPRPVTEQDLRRLLRAAWSGADPREKI